jgi:hypothetical protein
MYLPKLSVIYFYIWGGAIFLYSLNMITMLSGISFFFFLITFLIPIFIIIIFEFLFSKLYSFNKLKKNLAETTNNVLAKKKVLYFLFHIWVVLSVIDVTASGFLPLFSGSSSDDLNYTDYGVKGLGGINNSIAIVLSFGLAYLFTLKIDRTKVFLFVFSICFWQVLTLRRGILFSIVFIFLLLFLLNYYHKFKYFFPKLVILIFGLISIFGVLGDARGIKSPFNPLVRESFVGFFDILPSGFLWVYVYITSSMENLNNNLLLLFGGCQDVFYPIVSLAPSILRPSGSCEFILQIDYLNVGSYLALYVVTGNFFSFIFYLSIPIILTTFTRAMFIKTNNIGYLGCNIVLLLCWILSPFTNLFFLPTYVLAPVFLFVLFNLKIK